MPDGVITEALVRLEHKIDILINLLRQGANMFFNISQVGDSFNVCPVCNQIVEKSVDPIKKVVVRKCGCKTGLQVPVNLEAFAPPKSVTGGRKDGRDDSEYEDGSDTGSDRGDRRR
jgi:hypothetical protein